MAMVIVRCLQNALAVGLPTHPDISSKLATLSISCDFREHPVLIPDAAFGSRPQGLLTSFTPTARCVIREK